MGQAEDWDKLRSACLKYRNWGKWGPDDEIGCLNYVTPEKIANAGKLIQKGKVFSLAIAMDINGPQLPGGRRFNPMVFMLRDGSDSIAVPETGEWADDIFMMPTHGATHWDALGHVHYEGKMWNGYSASNVTSGGAAKCGIQTLKDKTVGRGVLLDVARYRGVEWLEAGEEITSAELDATAAKQKVEIKSGDFICVRTGNIGMSRKLGTWGETAAGDAPGVAFETCGWIYDHQIAAMAVDTWGCEVRPNKLKTGGQPWHRVVIPNIGMLMGEWFDLDALAEDCAQDGQYDFLMVAAVIPFTGAVGTPVNPIAIK